MNFDIISQVQEKLGRQVFKLSVLRDYSPEVGVELGKPTGYKDFHRSKWMYFNPRKEFVKFGKDMKFAVADLRRAWRTDNQNFYYVTVDRFGRARSLVFTGGVESGLSLAELENLLESKDIKSYNAGVGVGFGLQLLIGAVIGLAIGALLMYALFPAVSGALHG